MASNMGPLDVPDGALVQTGLPDGSAVPAGAGSTGGGRGLRCTRLAGKRRRMRQRLQEECSAVERGPGSPRWEGGQGRPSVCLNQRRATAPQPEINLRLCRSG